MLSGAAAILYRDNALVIVRHGESSDHPTGMYSLPGGRSESGDADTKQTATREIREETGLNVAADEMEFLQHYDFDLGGKGGNRKVSIDLFAYKVPSTERISQKPGYETMPMWVKMNDYLSGIYPTTYASKNFMDGVNDFLRKVSGAESKSL